MPSTYILTLGTGVVLKFGVGTGALTIMTGASVGNKGGANFASIRDDTRLGCRFKLLWESSRWKNPPAAHWRL